LLGLAWSLVSEAELLGVGVILFWGATWKTRVDTVCIERTRLAETPRASVCGLMSVEDEPLYRCRVPAGTGFYILISHTHHAVPPPLLLTRGLRSPHFGSDDVVASTDARHPVCRVERYAARPLLAHRRAALAHEDEGGFHGPLTTVTPDEFSHCYRVHAAIVSLPK